MRQLKEENWMHGRVRMVVASFLTKDLHVDWKIGEQHFRDYLIDYDANVNV
jgi:deoxyribodipyrimidine photo-lyase